MITTSYIHQKMETVSKRDLTGFTALFAGFLHPPEEWESHRATAYAPENAFWLFLLQVFSGSKSCAEMVAWYGAWRASRGLSVPSPDTGAYCKARGRLPIEDVRALEGEARKHMAAAEDPRGLWQGHRVRLADGTWLSMPDTPGNQQTFPQPRSQKPGCGFPSMHLVVMFSLYTGAIVDFAVGTLHTAERTLFRSLWDTLAEGDIVLTDRGFCSYADCYQLSQRRVHWVMRKHQSRTKGVTLVKKLGKNDLLVQWHKPKVRPKWMTREEWKAMPETMAVREITVHVNIPGFRSRKIAVVTSLLDPCAYPAKAFAELYRRRWNAELHLRDIKISQGMDILRCQSPEMVEKELLMHVLAYNLTRMLMGRAAGQHNLPPTRLSFMTSLYTLRHWQGLFAAASHGEIERLMNELLEHLGRARIPLRPNRVEPRARKRRPKAYPLLVKPRQAYRDILYSTAISSDGMQTKGKL